MELAMSSGEVGQEIHSLRTLSTGPTAGIQAAVTATPAPSAIATASPEENLDQEQSAEGAAAIDTTVAAAAAAAAAATAGLGEGEGSRRDDDGCLGSSSQTPPHSTVEAQTKTERRNVRGGSSRDNPSPRLSSCSSSGLEGKSEESEIHNFAHLMSRRSEGKLEESEAHHYSQVAGRRKDGVSEESEIHHHAQAGDVEGVRRCLLSAPDKNRVDQVDELGCTPVHLAGAMGHTRVVNLLVEHGAAVDARDGALCTALHAASEGGHRAMVELLLSLGAEIDARNGKDQTPLHYASGYGQVEAVEQLAIRNAAMRAQDVKGNIPLHLACGQGGVEVVRLLLASGSPPNAPNFRGRRPLHIACRNGHLEIAVALLEQGADPSTRDNNGMQAYDMIGVGRNISPGLKFDFVNALKRFHVHGFGMPRHPLSSTKSAPNLWRDRDTGSSSSRRGTPRGVGGAGMGDGGRTAVGLSSSAGDSGMRFGRNSFDGVSSAPFSSYDGFSAGGSGAGNIGGAVADEGRDHVLRREGLVGAGGGAPFASRGISEGDVRGIGGMGARSPRWTVGAAVAGRLEEMRARELGASLRAKVQENEAMKRYIASVKEEMRVLQRKVSSNPPSTSSQQGLMASFSSARDSADDGAQGSTSSSTPASSTVTEPHQPSIAEMVARGMYGSDGIVATRQQGGGGGGGSGGGGLFDDGGSCSPSVQATSLFAGGSRTSTENTAAVRMDVELLQDQGTRPGGEGEGVAPPAATGEEVTVVTVVAAGDDSTAAAAGPGDDDAGAPGGHGGVTSGVVAVDSEAGVGGGSSVVGPAPSSEEARSEVGGAESAAVAAGSTDQASPCVEAKISGGGSSAEQPGEEEHGVETGAGPVSISQLLDAKRAQLQSLLDSRVRS